MLSLSLTYLRLPGALFLTTAREIVGRAPLISYLSACIKEQHP